MFTDIAWTLTLAAAVASGTPLVFAGLGTLMAERVGVINLAVEGIMLLGAVVAVVIYGATQSIIFAFLASGVSGLLASALLCLIVIPFRSNQIVSGLALTIFLSGLSIFLGSLFAGETKVPKIENVPIPVLVDIPIVGIALFNHNYFVYLSWLVAIALSIFLFLTRPGLVARSLGENPHAAASLGIAVNPMRTLYVSIGGLLIGLGGGYIAVAVLGYWAGAATVAGIGWIAIALVIVASWRPILLLVSAYIFGITIQANFALQAAGISQVPPSILGMLPYLLTILLLTFLSLGKQTRGTSPRALGLPFIPGD